MNVRYILTLVRQLAPQLTDCRADEVGKGLYALHCKRDGMARCVQFDAHGIYGSGYSFNLPKSDDVIAVELAQNFQVKCQRCRKTLLRFAVEIPTKDGPIGWGPRCAAYVTIHRTRAGAGFGHAQGRAARAPRVDPAQLALELAL